VIPVVILASAATEQDAKEHFESLGGTVKVLKQTCSSKELLLAMIDLLHNCRRVEDIFQDLKKGQIASSKYPYLPLFENKQKDLLESDLAKNGSVSEHSVQFHVEEVDDGTECSSLLPEFLAKSPVKRLKEEKRSKQQAEQDYEESVRLKEEAERAEMRKWREQQLQNLMDKENPKEETKTEPTLHLEPKGSVK
jgi:hypothetical protein